MMKKLICMLLMLCLLLVGCAHTADAPAAPETPADTTAAEAPAEEAEAPAEEAPAEEDPAEEAPAEEEPAEEEPAEEEPAVTVHPLPDTTMDNLTDAMLSVSLEEGDAYVDDTGAMQMDLKIYTYDRYDMIDIAMLKVGDTLVRHDGEVLITALERDDSNRVCINGGLDAGGFELVTDSTGIFFESGYNDAKNWYEAGEATIRVSTEFELTDSMIPDQEPVVYPPGSFLVGEITDYHFTPHNTTIRVEGGQIVTMERIYTP